MLDAEYWRGGKSKTQGIGEEILNYMLEDREVGNNVAMQLKDSE
jgi:hypothetical protein